MQIRTGWLIRIVLFIMLAPAVSGQDANLVAGRLKKLGQDIPDTTRASVLWNLCFDYLSSNTDSAMMFGQQGLELARKINYPAGEFESLSGIAAVYSMTGNPDKSLQMLTAAIRIAEKNRMLTQLAYATGNMGSLYGEIGEYRQAADYYRQSIAAFKQLGNNRAIAGFLVYLGQVYSRMDQLDSALLLIREGMTTADSSKQKNVLCDAYEGMGDVLVKKRDTLTARSWYQRSFVLGTSIHNDDVAGSSLLSIARLQRKRSGQDSAIILATQSFRIASRSGFTRLISESAGFLAEQYANSKQYDSAYTYLKAQKAADDSLYSQEKLKALKDMQFSERVREQEARVQEKEYSSRLKLYALSAVAAILAAIIFMFWRNMRNKQRAFELLKLQKSEIEVQREKANAALNELQATQSQLIHAEKMASLGELTAGIAHEIQNPLNFVNNFSEVSVELIDEMKEAMEKNDGETAKEIAADIRENLKKIESHGKRADGIVKGMLQHSRTAGSAKEPTDINKLADEYLRLSYHGLRAKDKDFSAAYETSFAPDLPMVKLVPQEMGRVLLNLFNNAFYSVNQKKKNAGADYHPLVNAATWQDGNMCCIRVRDNGMGLSASIRDKIFQPFFTTKPTGQGTGLGLSISYDIIKSHGGSFEVSGKEGELAEFIIKLPVE